MTTHHIVLARPTVVFLDRDGTIIRDVHYLSRPEQVELIPGAAEAIAKLNHEQIPVILITNQSGIGRGLFTVADYDRTHTRLIELLAEHGARIDASYYCPHPPDMNPPCECRKPGTALFRQAIQEHQLDPLAAVYIGDRWRDIAPMFELGGHGILVPSLNTPTDDLAQAYQHATVLPTVAAAIDTMLVPPKTDESPAPNTNHESR